MNLMAKIIIISIVNCITFGLYLHDKKAAIMGEWRVPENTLLAMTFLGGGIGAAVGMIVGRHKIRKLKFLALVSIAVVMQAYIGYSFLT